MEIPYLYRKLSQHIGAIGINGNEAWMKRTAVTFRLNKSDIARSVEELRGFGVNLEAFRDIGFRQRKRRGIFP